MYPPPSPGREVIVQGGTEFLKPELTLEYEWLEKVNVTEGVAGAVNITLSAHHASQKRSQAFELSIAALLPRLRNQAHCCYNQTHAGQDQGHNVIPEPRTSVSNCC